MRDLIIIGGSVAATAAGVYAARRKLDFQVVSKDFGGEVATSGEIENWPGTIHTTGIELSEQFKKHLEAYQAPIDLDVDVEAIKKTEQGFNVVGERNGQARTYEARAVIVATGAHPRELGAEGEKEFRGKGVTYCTVCDGPLFSSKVVATIGGGNSALESALMLAGIASKVYLINKNAAMKGDELLIEKVNNLPNVTEIPNAFTKRFFGKAFLEGLAYKDTATNEEKTLEVQGAFVHIGMVPNSDFLPPEVEKNAFGEIKINNTCETSLPGLFAAGDVTDVPYKQIGVAAGQGICAALTAVSYLNRLG